MVRVPHEVWRGGQKNELDQERQLILFSCSNKLTGADLRRI